MLFYKQKWFPHFNHSIVKLDNTSYLSIITKGQGDDDDEDDDDIYIMVKCLYVCNVFAYFIFSLFWAPLGLEISDPQLDR